MRPFLKCPKCGLISKDEIMLDIPAMACIIKPQWTCKCTPEAEAIRSSAGKEVGIADRVRLNLGIIP
jgi:hypothetical protein